MTTAVENDCERVLAELPAGTLELAARYAAEVGSLGPERARRWLLAPLRCAEEDGRPAPSPSPPRRCGAGAVAAELGAPGDAELLRQMLTTLTPDRRRDPEAVAAEAQAWALPVLPFRRRGESPVADADGAVRVLARRAVPTGAIGAATGPPPAPLSGVRVCDLTTLWAGPLATAILAELGAEVIKVEPAVRPDGLRRWNGAGAGGRPSTFFTELNRGKRPADLDLRTPAGRAGFAATVREADVLVESFTPRVLPNLGFDRDRLWSINPSLLIASVRAFPPGPERAWRAFGGGIHAISGHGEAGSGFSSAPLAYPDPLTGIALAAGIRSWLGRRRERGETAAIEVSLADSVRPLGGRR